MEILRLRFLRDTWAEWSILAINVIAFLWFRLLENPVPEMISKSGLISAVFDDKNLWIFGGMLLFLLYLNLSQDLNREHLLRAEGFALCFGILGMVYISYNIGFWWLIMRMTISMKLRTAKPMELSRIGWRS